MAATAPPSASASWLPWCGKVRQPSPPTPGHDGGELDFGYGNDDAIADWGNRAVHESIVSGKALTARFYGRAPHHSYFAGCSTGGHQALMEAQRYPADFDGILAGDPGNNRTNLNFGLSLAVSRQSRAG